MIESQYLERIEKLEREVAELQNNEKDQLSLIVKLTQRVETLAIQYRVDVDLIKHIATLRERVETLEER